MQENIENIEGNVVVLEPVFDAAGEPVVAVPPVVMPAIPTATTTAWWTVERLLYGVALLLAAFARAWGIGGAPLSTWEASNAWPAWLAAHGQTVADAPLPNSALAYSLHWLTFWIGVNSEAGARIFALAAGIALVLLPWWWRGQIGRTAALILAFLLALDPWLFQFSRMADGGALALALGMATLISLTWLAQCPEIASGTAQRVAAICGGLLLVSGPLGWNMAPVVLLALWLWRGELREAGLFAPVWAAWAAGAALLGATSLLGRFEGLNWIATGFSVWLSQFDGNSPGPLLAQITGGYDVSWPWLRLLVDEALALVLGGAGIVLWAMQRVRGEVGDTRLGTLWLGWLAWGILLWLLPGRSPLALPMVSLPLLCFAATWLAHVLAARPAQIEWRETGAVVFTLAVLLISGVLWAVALVANRAFDPILAQAAGIILALALAILVTFAIWTSRQTALWVGAILLSMILGMVYIRSGWQLTNDDPIMQPSGWQAAVAHPEVRLLAEDVATLSAHRAGDPYEMPVQVQVAATVSPLDETLAARPDPIIGWQLRQMRNLTWVRGPQIDEMSSVRPLVITSGSSTAQEEANVALPAGYGGSVYQVEAWWLPRMLDNQAEETEEAAATWTQQWMAQQWTAQWQPWWRWLFYREVTQPPQTRDVVLWAPVMLEE